MEDSIYKDAGYQEEATEPENEFQPNTEPWPRPQTDGVLQKVSSNPDSLKGPRPGGGTGQLFAGGHKCNSSPIQDLHPQVALLPTPEAGEEAQQPVEEARRPGRSPASPRSSTPSPASSSPFCTTDGISRTPKFEADIFENPEAERVTHALKLCSPLTALPDGDEAPSASH